MNAAACAALGQVARGVGVAATAYETVNSVVNVANGKGTWKDAVTIGLGVATGVAMATGVGEVAVGVASIALGAYRLFSD